METRVTALVRRVPRRHRPDHRVVRRSVQQDRGEAELDISDDQATHHVEEKLGSNTNKRHNANKQAPQYHHQPQIRFVLSLSVVSKKSDET